MEAAQLQDAVAGFGGIVEAVVGAGEPFVVARHQLGAELVVALSDGFEGLASGFLGGSVCSGIEEGCGEGEGFKAVGRPVTHSFLQG